MRNFLQKMGDGFRRFMAGRYGSDQFGLFLSITLIVLVILVQVFQTVGTRLARRADKRLKD